MSDVAKLLYPYEPIRVNSFMDLLFSTSEKLRVLVVDESIKRLFEYSIWIEMDKYKLNFEYIYTIYI
jgi:hypothetical protein